MRNGGHALPIAGDEVGPMHGMAVHSATVDMLRTVLRQDAGQRRLIHVVPDASHSEVQVISIEAAPPRARILAGEVRENTLAGPDLTQEVLPIGIAHKEIALGSLIVDNVALFVFGTGINNRNRANALAA